MIVNEFNSTPDFDKLDTCTFPEDTKGNKTKVNFKKQIVADKKDNNLYIKKEESLENLVNKQDSGLSMEKTISNYNFEENDLKKIQNNIFSKGEIDEQPKIEKSDKIKKNKNLNNRSSKI